MKSRLLLHSLLLGSLAFSATPLQVAAQTEKPAHARYSVIDLGTLGGDGTNSSAYDMNQAGWVAGSSNLTAGGPQHAFLWFGGNPLFDLGTLGGPNSEANGPNAWGEAALVSETANTDPYGENFCGFGDQFQCLAAIWRNWRLTPLPTLPGGNNAQAYGLNDLGQVVGFSENGVHDPTCALSIPTQVFRYDAVIWEPGGKIRKLRPLPGDTVAFAFGINNNGQAVGTSGSCSNTSLPPANVNGAHAVLWEKDGTPFDLGNLGGVPGNIAGNINNRGDVAGTSAFPDGTVHSYLWTKAKGMRDLGGLPGAVITVAPCCNTINDENEIVGLWLDDMFNVSAFRWKDGVMRDLNDLIGKDSPWQLLFAQSLNNAGEIVGQGVINGELHAFLAVPCDGNHTGVAFCDDVTGATDDEVVTSRPRTALPESIRQQIRQQLRFVQFGPAARKP